MWMRKIKPPEGGFFEVVLGGGIMILSFLCVYFMAVLVMM